MAEAGTSQAPAADSPGDGNPGARIAALRARGAERFDPVAFRRIEVLLRHAQGHRGEARRLLDRRLAEAVATYGERFDQAGREAGDALAFALTRFPEAADALRQLGDAGDFGGLQRLLARLEARGRPGPLTDLLDHLGRPTPPGAPGVMGQASGTMGEPPRELKSMRHFRGTWSRLRADRQLSHALARAPENAGPLNAHFLVLQSLRLMRDLSPDYLDQFIAYVDALLWLDQADSSRAPPRTTAARGDRNRRLPRKP